jgi:2,4-dienoyl-CoA reductase-like NADH-dependent reductase (Old Yellow Enzyme family)
VSDSEKAPKIKHELPEAQWPSAEAAESSRLFSSVRIGATKATSRTWVPAMVPWRATEEGFVTAANREWYGRFADGRPGVLVVEATGIRDVPSGPLLRIGHDRFIPGMRGMCEVVRERSEGETRFFVQIIDFLSIRRRPTPEKYFGRFLKLRDEHRRRLGALDTSRDWAAASEEEVRERLLAADEIEIEELLDSRELESLRMGARERVDDTHLEHVRELPRTLPKLFAAATRRAREAGFDGVELHFAHAYTMASFLSPRNRREDGYGGSRENRLRLPREVIDACRAEVGRDFVLGCRFLGDEVIDDGNRIEDARFFARGFAEAGLDFLSVSKGGKFEDARQPRVGAAAYPYTGPSGHECMPTVRIDERGPFGRNLELSREVRAAVREAGFEIPVVGAGGLCTFDQMEAALAAGDCDIAAAARQSLADPDWWRKIRRGRGEEVRRCVFTNYCEGLDKKHKEVTCQLWDRFPIEPGENPAMSADGRRRLEAPPAG